MLVIFIRSGFSECIFCMLSPPTVCGAKGPFRTEIRVPGPSIRAPTAQRDALIGATGVLLHSTEQAIRREKAVDIK